MLDGYAFDEHSGGDTRSRVLRSQVDIYVLGLVIEKPSHGYEISQRYEARLGTFLQVSRSRIYKTLSRLERDGLIEAMPAEALSGARRGAKAGSSYRATPDGARAYRGWLAERVREDPQRVEMLGRLTLAGVNSVEAALGFIDGYEQQCVREAQALAPPADVGSASGALVGLVQRLLLEERRRRIDAQLAWISYARAELRAANECSAVGEERP